MKPLFAIAVCIFVSSNLHATSRIYSSLEHFIQKSTVIAIVEVGPRSPDVGYPNPDRKANYRQKSEAIVKQLLKGELPQTIEVLHGKELDDYLFQQGQGVYLVFLKHTPVGLVPFDGWPSSKEIKDNRVLGWAAHPYYWHDSGTPLERVLSEIKVGLNKQDKS